MLSRDRVAGGSDVGNGATVGVVNGARAGVKTETEAGTEVGA